MGSYSNPSLVSRFRGILAGQTDNRVSGRSRPTRQIQRHLSENEVLSLVRAHARGDTIDELATTFDIHRTTVMAHLERQGAPRRSGTVTKNIDEATRLYEEGWSLARLGEHFSVDGETVRRALRAAGVTLRPRRGWT
jgi:DNA-directed RNA polymerase specialized sigma24 family protein